MKKTLSKRVIQETVLPPKNVGSKKNYIDLMRLMIVISLGIIIYSNSFNCSFHFDDYANFIDNVRFPDLTDFKAWWNYSHSRVIGSYSFALNIYFNQYDVWGYHLVNLIIHLINACLVWWLTKIFLSTPVMKDHLLAKYKNELAFFTAILFVSHPLATQSVTYIVQRLASMVAMFYLLSITLYLKARLTEKGKKFKFLLFAGSFLSAILAMFTKENAFTLPFAILLVEFFFLHTKQFSFNLLKNYRGILIILSFLSFIVFLFIKYSSIIFLSIAPNEVHPTILTPVKYLLTQFSVIVKYIQLLFVPLKLQLDYDFPVSNSFLEIRTLLSFLLLTGLLVMAIFIYHKNRIVSFSIFWFFLTLSIESSFIPINDLIFEHRTYLPSFGFFLIFSSVIFILFREKYKFLGFTILAMVIGFNSYLTYQRNKVWKDDLSLWNDNVNKTPNLARPFNNRGYAYRKLGQWQKALIDYNKSLELYPDYPSALLNRGTAYAHFKMWDKAIVDYTWAIANKANFAEAYSNRGAAYGALQLWDKAIKDCSKSIEINPNNAEAYFNRGATYERIGKLDDAIADFTSAIRLKPDYLEALNNRGAIYEQKSKYDEAIEDFTKVIRLKPNLASAYFNRGVAYKNLKEWSKAINDYTMAIKMNSKFKEAYVNRGFVYSEAGQLEKAIEDYSMALKIDPNYTLAHTNREYAYKNLQSSKNH